MNADEQRLIEDLFVQLRTLQSSPKDRDADLFIRDLIRQSPDAPYYLVQTAIVQQEALNQADARIRDLEDAARQAQRNDAPRSGSFLSGAAVPRSGGRYQDPPSRPLDQPASPWSQPAQPASGAGGGFLSSALSTAGGVAGGMFLADSIRSLFGGSTVGASSGTSQAALEQAQRDAQSARNEAAQAKKDLAADDAAIDESVDEQDDDADYGGSDDGSYDV